MATTNHERVGKALELLKAGLGSFVDREVQTAVKAHGIDAATLRRFVDDPRLGDRPATDWDVAALLKLMAPVGRRQARGARWSSVLWRKVSR